MKVELDRVVELESSGFAAGLCRATITLDTSAASFSRRHVLHCHAVAWLEPQALGIVDIEELFEGHPLAAVRREEMPLKLRIRALFRGVERELIRGSHRDWPNVISSDVLIMAFFISRMPSAVNKAAILDRHAHPNVRSPMEARR